MRSGGSSRVGGLLAVLVLGMGLALYQQASQAQVTKGKTRAAATKYLMRGVQQPHCAAAGKLLKEGPKDDKQWDTLACHASILNEMSLVLLEDGRCPDQVWAGAVKALRSGSDSLLKAANHKELEEARAAFKSVTGSCGSCHEAHKK